MDEEFDAFFEEAKSLVKSTMDRMEALRVTFLDYDPETMSREEIRQAFHKVHTFVIGYSRETANLLEAVIEEHSFLKRKLDEGRKFAGQPGDGDGLTVSVRS